LYRLFVLGYVTVVIVIIKNLLMPVQQNSITHLREVLLFAWYALQKQNISQKHTPVPNAVPN
jgi:hypothetical protein